VKARIAVIILTTAIVLTLFVSFVLSVILIGGDCGVAIADVVYQQSQQRELDRINHAIKAHDATDKVGRCNYKLGRMYFEFNDPFTSITSGGLTVGTAASARFKVRE
jgi:hypothetical protein